jgi:hypothetical protein
MNLTKMFNKPASLVLIWHCNLVLWGQDIMTCFVSFTPMQQM